MSKYAGFQKVKMTRPTKSTFDLSHEKRLSAQMGKCTPVLFTECVPSDYFRGSTEMLVRLAPLLAPIYDQIQVYVHFYFAPLRILYEDFEDFMTGGRLGVGIDPLLAPIVPQGDIGGIIAENPGMFLKGSIADYLGVPLFPLAPNDGPDYDGTTIDMLLFAAYQRIFAEYYRDRNWVDDLPLYMEPLPSGVLSDADCVTLMQEQVRSYKHDYFTSALNFTQRGEEVLIPLEGQVTYLQQSIIKRSDTGVPLTNFDLLVGTQSVPDFPPGTMGVSNDLGATEQLAARVENIDGISNISTTINDFRAAYALQVWLERNAVGGSRYTESTQAHFGVRPQDSRLQRPEYIGGGRIPVKISEVVSTAYSTNGDDDTIPLANMGGHGVTYGNTNHFNYFCTEHGYIMGILTIMNPPSYHQGLPKVFRRRSFLDYPWPTFAKLGEQPVNDHEIYASAESLTEDVDGELPRFGYQSRYADWKHIANTNHGDFHDDLLFWTLTRHFEEPPILSNDFMVFDPSTEDRIFAVQGIEDNFWIYVHNKLTVKRPLPYFGTPNTLGFV